MVTKKKMTISPSQFKNQDLLVVINKDDSSIQQSFNDKNSDMNTVDDKLKSFTFKIYESELEQIRKIQQSLPKRDRISISDFVISAVKDRISKQSKKLKNYN